MRRMMLVAIGFCLAVLMSQSALATGNVLLPSSGTSNTPAPNLGITPPAPAAQPSTAPAINAPSAPAAPTASTPEAAVPAAPSLSDVISAVDEATAKNLPVGDIPTRIIHQPDGTAALARATASLPKSLSLSFSNRSVFGSNDVVTITKTLGLSRDQIAASCYLSVSGIIQTDQTAGIVDGGLAVQILTRYSGNITGTLLTAKALCTAGKLPPGSGFITQIGNRYVVPLQPITCASPTRLVTQMIITYDGTSNSSCAYQ